MTIQQRFPQFDFETDTDGKVVTRGGSEAKVCFFRPKFPTYDPKLTAGKRYALRIETLHDTAYNRAKVSWVQHCANTFNKAPFVETLDQQLLETYSGGRIEYVSIMPCYTTSLFEYASYHRPPPTTATIRSIIAQILSALAIMHDKGYAHRDLSGNNILLDFDQNGIPHVHVGDFGFTSRYHPDLKIVPSDGKGTVPYQSPESLQKRSDFDPFGSDIWAVGINMRHLIMKKLDWLNNNKASQIRKVKYQMTCCTKILQEVSAQNDVEGIELLRLLLDKDQSSRITAEEALNHQWFSNESPCTPFLSRLPMHLSTPSNVSAMDLIHHFEDRPETVNVYNRQAASLPLPELSVEKALKVLKDRFGLNDIRSFGEFEEETGHSNRATNIQFIHRRLEFDAEKTSDGQKVSQWTTAALLYDVIPKTDKALASLNNGSVFLNHSNFVEENKDTVRFEAINESIHIFTLVPDVVSTLETYMQNNAISKEEVVEWIAERTIPIHLDGLAHGGLSTSTIFVTKHEFNTLPKFKIGGGLGCRCLGLASLENDLQAIKDILKNPTANDGFKNGKKSGANCDSNSPDEGFAFIEEEEENAVTTYLEGLEEPIVIPNEWKLLTICQLTQHQKHTRLQRRIIAAEIKRLHSHNESISYGKWLEFRNEFESRNQQWVIYSNYAIHKIIEGYNEKERKWHAKIEAWCTNDMGVKDEDLLLPYLNHMPQNTLFWFEWMTKLRLTYWKYQWPPIGQVDPRERSYLLFAIGLFGRSQWYDAWVKNHKDALAWHEDLLRGTEAECHYKKLNGDVRMQIKRYYDVNLEKLQNIEDNGRSTT